MNSKNLTPEWLRWVGLSSALVVLFLLLLFPRDTLGSTPGRSDILMAAVFFVMPAVLAMVISFSRWIRLVAFPGLWLLFLAVAMRSDTEPPRWSILFLVAAFSMCLVPLIDLLASRRTRIGSTGDAKSLEKE